MISEKQWLVRWRLGGSRVSTHDGVFYANVPPAVLELSGHGPLFVWRVSAYAAMKGRQDEVGVGLSIRKEFDLKEFKDEDSHYIAWCWCDMLRSDESSLLAVRAQYGFGASQMETGPDFTKVLCDSILAFYNTIVAYPAGLLAASIPAVEAMYGASEERRRFGG